jgi:hypothetical protein
MPANRRKSNARRMVKRTRREEILLRLDDMGLAPK